MADDANQVGQDEVEELLRQAQSGAGSPPPPSDPKAGAPEAGSLELAPDEIEALSRSNPASKPQPSAGKPAPPAAAQAASSTAAEQQQNDIESLLSHAEQALASLDEPNDEMPAGIAPFQFKNLAATGPSNDQATLELVREVQLDLKIELGRTQMYLEDVLRLKKGAVVPLDKLAGDPVDIYVNGRLIARGEVLVLNDNFCVRVAELIVGHATVA